VPRPGDERPAAGCVTTRENGPEMLPSRPLPRTRSAARVASVAAALAALGASAPSVLAHGPVPGDPPDAARLLLGWSIQPLPAIPILVAALLWMATVRRVDAAHPANPVPRARTAAWLGGLATIAVALMSGIERYDTTLFSVHMVQHLLLSLVAAPLLVLAGPVTLLLRAVSPETRRRTILPILHSRLLRAVSFPVVAWVLFAGTLWAAHFSPLFDLALEDPLVHDVEHALFLGTALLFWWPAIGVDPSPWRLARPARILYVFLQMPQNTFLAVAILGAREALYPHYATLVRSWGPSPLADQQTAAGIMWMGGDLAFLAVILLLVAAWMRHEEGRTAHEDRRADAARAAIRDREARLAERLGEERRDVVAAAAAAPAQSPGSGEASNSR
jgi:cytochrome c oxidase assembly factor CtaG